MRNKNNVFHLAIPVKNLDEAYDFYIKKLGCKMARRYNDRITIDFFGDQLVCHLAPKDITEKPKPYPRHFGVTFNGKQEFDNLVRLVESREIEMFQKIHLRFKGLIEEHYTFMIIDPSNNILEFKYYFDPRMMY